MIQRNRNIAFYHVSMLVRRKRNQILAIKNAVGEWIYEDSGVKDHIRAAFRDIFTSSFLSAPRVAPASSQWQAKLTDEENFSISGVATEDEIKAALWSLKAFKALGPDGLHAGFFHRFWLIVGSSVIDEVKRVFVERRVPEYLNRTHIILFQRSKARRL